MDFRKIEINGNGDLETIMRLKKSPRKVYIYGCAAQAEMLFSYLEKHEIRVEGFLVDHNFYHKNTYMCDREIYDIDSCINEVENYDIVIGFCEVNKTRFLLSNRKIVRGNYYLIWEHDFGYVWDRDYFENHNAELSRIYDELADEKSRNILRGLAFSKLNHRMGNLLDLADNNQYYNELTYELDSSNEVYIDCGAFNGDTILKYNLFTDGKYKKIYAFEPGEDNRGILEKNVQGLHDIEVIPKGVWSEEKKKRFDSNGSSSCISEVGNSEVELIAIDDIVGKDKVTFIKMDIEGSELEALRGAQSTIQRDMPKLAICCYHKANDIIDLYTYIKSFCTKDIQYKFYLRHHSNCAYETVLYAIPYRQKYGTMDKE